MNNKLVIFAPFERDFTPNSGTTIRIAGYTKGLNELGVDYTFYASVKPDYVPDDKFISCTIGRKWIKIFVLHNIFFSNIALRPISYLFRWVLFYFADGNKGFNNVGNRIIWTHQEYSLALFLYFVYGKQFIYDIHGFFDIQREYRISLNRWRKCWFDLFLRHERVVLKRAPYINVVSERMFHYVKEEFHPLGKILIAPDGIPVALDEYEQTVSSLQLKQKHNIKPHEKIILYAGSFKKIGGVSELVKVYCAEPTLYNSAILILIGKGQEESIVNEIIAHSDCKNRIVFISSLPHQELISYMKMSDIIVCPDIEGNKYNEMTPHIKLYDAVASGSKVVATDFEVNTELFPSHSFPVYYFTYREKDGLKKVLVSALTEENAIVTTKTMISEFTYTSRLRNYIQNYENELFC